MGLSCTPSQQRAVAFKEASEPDFKIYQTQIVKNAKALAARLIENGFRLVSGGTDNHLMLIDLTSQYEKLSGRQAADHLEDAGIIVNKNTIPFDKRKPRTTSGIRLGTPMITTRGMKEDEMVRVADFITETLEKQAKSRHQTPDSGRKSRNSAPNSRFMNIKIVISYKLRGFRLVILTVRDIFLVTVGASMESTTVTKR